MRLSEILPAGLLLMIPISAPAQSASGRCEVVTHRWSKQAKLGSGVMRLGGFKPLVADVSTFKTYRAADDLIVTVGVQYEDYPEKRDARYREVRLMVTASNQQAPNVFGLVGSSEASTAFRKRWYLTASTRIEAADQEHTFTLRCWDDVKFPR